MASSMSRARFVGAVAGAFVSGLVVTAALDLTSFGWAQQGTLSRPSAQEIKPLADVGSAFESIAEHVTPAVVSIQAERRARPRQALPRGRQPGLEDLFRQFEQVPEHDQIPQESSGSGFIVSKDGYILTNNHVVADADRLTVTLLDKRTFPAKVIGRDPDTDVAVIKIDGSNLPVVAFGDDERTRVGQWVLAIGNPLGLDFTVTAGIVSSKGRNLQGLLPSRYAIADFIQTDAAINPGNSGGPLVNIRGEVIGINSAIASSTGYYAGYGFAIPITLARTVMDDLIAHGRVRRAVLGVGINEVTPEQARSSKLDKIAGVLVGSYSGDDSPAKEAGIELGDVIVAVDGKPTDQVNSLQRIVRAHRPGETLTVDVVRYGQRKSFRVKLAEAPREESEVAEGRAVPRAPSEGVAGRDAPKLGVTVGALPADVASAGKVAPEYRNGVLVTAVSPSGPAFRKLARQDIIVAVLSPAPRREVRSVADLERALSGLRDGDVVTFLIYNIEGRATRVQTIKIGDQ